MWWPKFAHPLVEIWLYDLSKSGGNMTPPGPHCLPRCRRCPPIYLSLPYSLLLLSYEDFSQESIEDVGVPISLNTKLCFFGAWFNINVDLLHFFQQIKRQKTSRKSKLQCYYTVVGPEQNPNFQGGLLALLGDPKNFNFFFHMVIF